MSSAVARIGMLAATVLCAVFAVVLSQTGASAQDAREVAEPGVEPAPQNPPVVYPEDGPPPDEAPVVVLDNGLKVAAGEYIINYEGQKAFERDRGADGHAVEAFPEIDARLVEFEGLEEAAERRGPKKAGIEADLKAKKKELEAEPGVESVEYNALAEPAYVPNDPYARNGAQDNTLGVIRAYQGFGLRGSSGNESRIAVIDTGYDYGHPDLAGTYPGSGEYKIDGAYDFYNNGTYTNDTASGHGTHVASIAAGFSNNGRGISGVARHSDLLIAQVVRSDGLFDEAAIIEAIDWAANNGADAINMSFTWPPNVYTGDALGAAIKRAWFKGAVPVAATGNHGEWANSVYPASYPYCMGVGNVEGSGGVYRTSNKGPMVNVVAPGTWVLAAVPDNTYGRMTGTSMATPQVAGLAAVLKAERPTRSADFIVNRIQGTATGMGPAGYDQSYGHGRIDFYRAMVARD